ncbi:MAG: redoxin domain-containing protein [Alphaproteobacteria bacterium]|nr:redoxin domain-containing protein [Alphaproteobacteria bacterium]
MIIRAAALSLALFATGPVAAQPAIGAPAPAFEGVTSAGATITLTDLAGKTVVLEWTNDGCPFVQKHYGSGNMQAAMDAVTGADGVWISVISSTPGSQGHVDGPTADALNEERGAAPTYVVLDPEGTIGRAYAAKTTPHMFVIDADGVLRYDGAIDDRPSPALDSLEGAQNYVLAAFGAVSAGADVDPARTKPYGCSVKYGS